MSNHDLPEYGELPTLTVRLQAAELVRSVAVAHNVPVVYITAHIQKHVAHVARLEVQRRMFTELGIKRQWIAFAFHRDLRRVRKSVIGV